MQRGSRVICGLERTFIDWDVKILDEVFYASEDAGAKKGRGANVAMPTPECQVPSLARGAGLVWEKV